MVKTKEELSLYFKNWYDKNGNRKKYNDLARSKILKSKIECFEAYGNKCSCCGEKEIAFLTIDHIGGDGCCTKERRKKNKHQRGYYEYRRLKKIGYPKDKYQILCMNCNFAVRGGRICPHQKQNIIKLNLIQK